MDSATTLLKKLYRKTFQQQNKTTRNKQFTLFSLSCSYCLPLFSLPLLSECGVWSPIQPHSLYTHKGTATVLKFHKIYYHHQDLNTGAQRYLIGLHKQRVLAVLCYINVNNNDFFYWGRLWKLMFASALLWCCLLYTSRCV